MYTIDTNDCTVEKLSNNSNLAIQNNLIPSFILQTTEKKYKNWYKITNLIIIFKKNVTSLKMYVPQEKNPYGNIYYIKKHFVYILIVWPCAYFLLFTLPIWAQHFIHILLFDFCKIWLLKIFSGIISFL